MVQENQNLGHDANVHTSFRDIFSYLNIGLMFALEPVTTAS
jgi:hypothetical protein